MKTMTTLFLMLSLLMNSAFAKVTVHSKRIEKKKSYVAFTATLSNEEVLKGKCILSKDFTDTVFAYYNDYHIYKDAHLEVEMEDGRIESGFIRSSMTVAKKTLKSDDTCEACGYAATVFLPVIIIPAVIWGTIKDTSRTIANRRFLKEAIKTMNIPDCAAE